MASIKFLFFFALAIACVFAAETERAKKDVLVGGAYPYAYNGLYSAGVAAYPTAYSAGVAAYPTAYSAGIAAYPSAYSAYPYAAAGYGSYLY